MEFLRFGSSIPGSYWGCCAVCIIQKFSYDPDAPASIQIVNGDEGYPVGDTFAGPTYRDIFHQRLRCGTFSEMDMPNHVFLAVMTEGQLTTTIGKAWLTILKETGFEFIRTTDNSVYSGPSLEGAAGHRSEPHPNYLFGLFRNIGNGSVENPYKPPKAWTDLPSCGVAEVFDTMNRCGTDMNEQNKAAHRVVWDRIGKPVFMTRAEVEAAGVPVTLAGIRSQYPQQLASTRPADVELVDPFADEYDEYDEDCEEACM